MTLHPPTQPDKPDTVPPPTKRPEFAVPFDDLFRPLFAFEADALRASLSEHGVRSPVLVYDSAKRGKSIIDGANRWRISGELSIDCPVNDLGAMSDDDARKLAEELNLCRRHLAPADWKAMQAARAERVARVVAARAKGKSIRGIAYEEGVDSKTIQKDLKKAGVDPSTPEPAGEVKGTDGKVYKASAPQKPKAATPPGIAVPQGEPQQAKAGGEEDERPGSASDRPDQAALVAPADQADADEPTTASADPSDAFCALVAGMCRELDDLARRVEGLKASPFARFVHWQSAQLQLKNARETLWGGRPTHECPYCAVAGEPQPSCRCCNGLNVTTRSRYKAGEASVGKGGGK